MHRHVQCPTGLTHMQRRIALAVPTVHVRPAGQQLLGDPLVAAARRQVHGRLAVLVLGVPIAVAALQQLRHHRHVALARRPVQQIGAAVAARIVRRLVAAHESGQRRNQPVGGAAIVLDQRVEAVYRLLFVDREEGVLAVPPDLVVVDLVVVEHGQHVVAVRCVALAHQERAVVGGALCECVWGGL